MAQMSRGEEFLFPPYKHHLARVFVVRGMSGPKKERLLEKGRELRERPVWRPEENRST